MKLVKVIIHKYKAIYEKQEFDVNKNLTCLIGENESGKTLVLEALYKQNNDEDEKFNEITDYPKGEFISGAEKVIECQYEINNELIDLIEENTKTRIQNNISITTYFNNNRKVEYYKLGERINETNIDEIIHRYEPKYKYFSSYDLIPLGNIDINSLKDKKNETNILEKLFKLSRINIEEIISKFETNDTETENVMNSLNNEATRITKLLRSYWDNDTIIISFNKIIQKHNNSYINKLRISIDKRSTFSNISMPLKNRSHGFIWFFSFLIVFEYIKLNKENVIYLLDEPALNLHAYAQKNSFLKFMKEFCQKYQTIYTTHSPFLIDDINFNSIKYISQEKHEKTIITQKLTGLENSKTIYPVISSIGYNIIENIFPKNTLVVEGISDMIYILSISENFKNDNKRTPINEEIKIIPLGGLSNLTFFTILLNTQNINFVLLYDELQKNNPNKQKIEELANLKIIKNLICISEFLDDKDKNPEIEDLFTKEDFEKILKLKYKDEDINIGNKKLSFVKQVKDIDKIEIASKTAKNLDLISEETKDRFQKMFIKINSYITNAQ